jgi:hypothetical protein
MSDPNEFQASIAQRANEQRARVLATDIKNQQTRVERESQKFELDEDGKFKSGDARAFKRAELSAKRVAQKQVQLSLLFNPPNIKRPETPQKPTGSDSFGEGLSFSSIAPPIDVAARGENAYSWSYPALPGDNTKTYVLGLKTVGGAFRPVWLETEACDE